MIFLFSLSVSASNLLEILPTLYLLAHPNLEVKEEILMMAKLLP